MKKLIFLTLFLGALCASWAQDYVESENFATDSYIDVTNPLKTIRQINGGTVFKIEYGDGFTVEMKGAFEYACKLLEEYIPTCLPITVYAEWGNLSSTSSTQTNISKVLLNAPEGFGGESQDNRTSPMAKIKYITLGEFIKESTISYFDSIPDVTFLDDPSLPDIRIVYNSNLIDDFSFSLEETQYDKYDFVSVVLRDLLKALGFSTEFKVNPLTNNQISVPRGLLTDFEVVTKVALGNGTPASLYSAATQGEVSLTATYWNYTPLKLYAPTTWQNNVSLNYFVPDTTYAVTQVLSHEFGRGTVLRNINDTYGLSLFRSFLGWQEDFLISTSTPSNTSGGSTANILPYNGSFSVGSNSASGLTYTTENADVGIMSLSTSDAIQEQLTDYVRQFHPSINLSGSIVNEGWTVSILKKDGTWDVALYIYTTSDDIEGQMSDLTLHYDQEEYARTCDGHLRVRFTKAIQVGRRNTYTSYYYVASYTPQKVELGLAHVESSSSQTISSVADATTPAVRIGMKNVEGCTRIVIEKLLSGNRLPVRTTLTDFKKGYFDATLSSSRDATFTAIAYNDNGSTTSESITIRANSLSSSSSPISISNGQLIISSEDLETLEGCLYRIVPIQTYTSKVAKSGVVGKEGIDLSNLSTGIYTFQVIYDGEIVVSEKFHI
ncbi:MAG: hypothetical protein LUD17_09610 [Bacteroidales bacterium]|nr:hypothetical protein [Bacteroidales bacterium]